MSQLFGLQHRGDGEIDMHSLNTIRKTNQNLRPRDSCSSDTIPCGTNICLHSKVGTHACFHLLRIAFVSLGLKKRSIIQRTNNLV